MDTMSDEKEVSGAAHSTGGSLCLSSYLVPTLWCRVSANQNLCSRKFLRIMGAEVRNFFIGSQPNHTLRETGAKLQGVFAS